VNHNARLAGLDAAQFSGRAGFVTSAAESGAAVLKSRRQPSPQHVAHVSICSNRQWAGQSPPPIARIEPPDEPRFHVARPPLNCARWQNSLFSLALLSSCCAAGA
jgi:hypothetical protein